MYEACTKLRSMPSNAFARLTTLSGFVSETKMNGLRRLCVVGRFAKKDLASVLSVRDCR